MNLLAADNILPVATEELAASYEGTLADVVNTVSEALDTETLTDLNRRFDIEREDADDIAADFLAEATSTSADTPRPTPARFPVTEAGWRGRLRPIRIRRRWYGR